LIIWHSASHQRDLLLYLFISCQNVILIRTMLICNYFALAYRNDDEENAFSSFLSLSRFPQVEPEICSLGCGDHFINVLARSRYLFVSLSCMLI
jgi:hypothetical protein